MTTILCFLTIKYQLSNTLSQVCFEKMPESWEFTHAWQALPVQALMGTSSIFQIAFVDISTKGGIVRRNIITETA